MGRRPRIDFGKLRELLFGKPKQPKKPPPCTNCRRSRKDIEDEANVSETTKGRTKIGEKSGGFDQANKDFDSLEPGNVKPINTRYGPGRVGQLENGDTVVVRPGSSDGRPTLEFRNPANMRGSEIRYGP